MTLIEKTFLVDNIKCSGCAHTVSTQLSKLEGIENVEVIPEEDSVTVSFSEEAKEETIARKLHNLGYPPKGTSNLTDNAKSYVSCMIGKITK